MLCILVNTWYSQVLFKTLNIQIVCLSISVVLICISLMTNGLLLHIFLVFLSLYILFGEVTVQKFSLFFHCICLLITELQEFFIYSEYYYFMMYMFSQSFYFFNSVFKKFKVLTLMKSIFSFILCLFFVVGRCSYLRIHCLIQDCKDFPLEIL